LENKRVYCSTQKERKKKEKKGHVAKSGKSTKKRSSTSMSSGLKDSHRAFVQAIMSRRYVSAEEAQKLQRKACDLFGDKDLAKKSLGDFIKPLNDELHPLEFALRLAQSHDTEEKSLMFVNTGADESAKLATHYNASQISFIKKVIELIVTAEDDPFHASATDLVNNAIDKKARSHSHPWRAGSFFFLFFF